MISRLLHRLRGARLGDAGLAHPTDEALLCLVDGELPPREAARVQRHVEACWSCRHRRARMQQTIDAFMEACADASADERADESADDAAFVGTRLPRAAIAALRASAPRASAFDTSASGASALGASALGASASDAARSPRHAARRAARRTIEATAVLASRAARTVVERLRPPRLRFSGAVAVRLAAACATAWLIVLLSSGGPVSARQLMRQVDRAERAALLQATSPVVYQRLEILRRATGAQDVGGLGVAGSRAGGSIGDSIGGGSIGVDLGETSAWEVWTDVTQHRRLARRLRDDAPRAAAPSRQNVRDAAHAADAADAFGPERRPRAVDGARDARAVEAREDEAREGEEAPPAAIAALLRAFDAGDAWPVSLRAHQHWRATQPRARDAVRAATTADGESALLLEATLDGVRERVSGGRDATRYAPGATTHGAAKAATNGSTNSTTRAATIAATGVEARATTNAATRAASSAATDAATSEGSPSDTGRDASHASSQPATTRLNAARRDTTAASAAATAGPATAGTAPSATADAILRGALLVRERDWHPVEQRLTIRVDAGVEEIVIREAGFAVLPRASLPVGFFDGGATTPAPRSHVAAAPAIVAAPSPAELVTAEVQAMHALHLVGVTTADEIAVHRRARTVDVVGLTTSDERRRAMLAALAPIALVQTRIQTVDEALGTAVPASSASRDGSGDAVSASTAGSGPTMRSPLPSTDAERAALSATSATADGIATRASASASAPAAAPAPASASAAASVAVAASGSGPGSSPVLATGAPATASPLRFDAAEIRADRLPAQALGRPDGTRHDARADAATLRRAREAVHQSLTLLERAWALRRLAEWARRTNSGDVTPQTRALIDVMLRERTDAASKALTTLDATLAAALPAASSSSTGSAASVGAAAPPASAPANTTAEPGGTPVSTRDSDGRGRAADGGSSGASAATSSPSAGVDGALARGPQPSATDDARPWTDVAIDFFGAAAEIDRDTRRLFTASTPEAAGDITTPPDEDARRLRRGLATAARVLETLQRTRP